MRKEEIGASCTCWLESRICSGQAVRLGRDHSEESAVPVRANRDIPLVGSATQVADQLFAAGLRARPDNRNETLGKKVREAQLARVNYQAVVGEREVESGTVSIRSRSGAQVGTLTVEQFQERSAAKK